MVAPTNVRHEQRTRPIIDLEALMESAILSPMRQSMEFILALKNASLDDNVAKLSTDALERLQNPPDEVVTIDNPGICFAISTYLALENASQQAYNRVCEAGTPAADSTLSFYNIEKLISTYTGVVSIEHDMCHNSCIAYTRPFSHLKACPMCHTSRWKEEQLQGTHRRSKVAAQTFTTIPIGPQLQALYRHKDSAIDMGYLTQCTAEVLQQLHETGCIPLIDDIAMGWDYLRAVLDGDIKHNDAILMLLLDGAQLYDSKESDCWMYIWIVIHLPPDKRYRKLHVCPGGFIPSPNKPKNLDSFLFPGIHHLAALQAKGLPIWNAHTNTRYSSDVYLLFTTADGPGLIYWNGMVGHSGKNGCCMYCGAISRCKTNGKHYYPALLQPRNHCVCGSDHADIDMFSLLLGGCAEYADNLRTIIAMQNPTQWDKKKTDTGLTKPPLILTLQPTHSLGIPLCMTTDIMHLAGNISDLLISLWHGTIDHVAGDDPEMWPWAVLANEEVWHEHGAAIEQAGHHLPSSYDHKPRNIAEKINTQYKTWEFQLYIFALVPILLYDLLPRLYWVNYCKLVRRLQIMCQHTLTEEQLLDAHALLCSWECEFESIYYQLRECHIHFVRPCIHQVIHLVPEAIHKGPPICYVQWTMEQTIGNLSEQIRQPSKPYTNLSREGICRCQVNSLISIIPELNDSVNRLPYGSLDLHDGFTLLHKHSKTSILPHGDEGAAIVLFLGPGHPLPHIKKWARLCLPNGQVACSAWRESLRPPEQLRVSRNIKCPCDGITRCAKVQYFTRLPVQAADGNWTFTNVAIVRLYSVPDKDLLKLSNHVLLASQLLNAISVIHVKQIISVIAMIPRQVVLPSGIAELVYCMMERPRFDVSDWGVPYSMYVKRDDEDDGHEDVE
ncbi:hypothetical protein M404DRAFT_167725 [Pisolithus tinctorius Marx 270]|uniref:Uncharacterized protein n=1 Tax=Pisolithus tinctorius Marx 270 TaxID=870435 RepID=A0A0C3N0I8_PISTI|nr:hypothetical protein M404DRAFT_167725 [Pisolithus tinctorius Marx 270]